MPRFRFNWSNLPEDILDALARYLGLDGEPSEGLRRAYGARPKEDFIADTWQILQDCWLQKDEQSLRSIATTLRERGVGQVDVSDDRSYVRSCRNTSGLRRVVLPQFISIGEEPRDALGSAPATTNSGESQPFRGNDRLGGAVVSSEKQSGDAPSTQTIPPPPKASDSDANPVEHFRSWIGSVLKDFFENPELTPDDDGDFALPQFGSSQLFISVMDKPLRLEIFSILLSDVEYSEQLLKTLNLINGRLMFERITYLPEGKMVVLSTQLNALGISQDALMTHVKMCAMAADHFDTHLSELYGGQKAGTDRRPDEQVV